MPVVTQTFTANGPFVVDSRVSVLDSVEIVAGGGGGGNRILGQAGGGAGAERRLLTNVAVTPAESLDIVIGGGGAGCVAGINGNGSSGGNTTFKRGATTLGQAVGGGAGQQSAASVGGTGGTGGAGTDGVAGQDRFSGGGGGASGSGAGGGAAPGGNGSNYGGGGAGGDGTVPANGGNGASGVVIITYTIPPFDLASISYALAISPLSFVHAGKTAIDGLTYSVAIGAVNFLHGGVTTLESVSYSLAISDVVFGRRTSLDPLAYTLSISPITFSTSGGTVPSTPTNIVLPNRSATQRSLPATWTNLRFRNFDTIPTRTQKLEILREKVVDAASLRTMMFSFVEGLPTANPAEPLVRIVLLNSIATGAIIATAGNAATGTVAFRFFKNGVANGTVSFTGTTGTEVGVGDWAAGDTFEIYPPTTADPTLDDVSISIPVTIG